MDDATPVRLSAARWAVLNDYIVSLNPTERPTGVVHVFKPIDIAGITFLPARYIGPDEAEPMPAEPPVKPRPAPAFV